MNRFFENILRKDVWFWNDRNLIEVPFANENGKIDKIDLRGVRWNIRLALGKILLPWKVNNIGKHISRVNFR